MQWLQELKQIYRNVLLPHMVSFKQRGLHVRSHAIYKSCRRGAIVASEPYGGTAEAFGKHLHVATFSTGVSAIGTRTKMTSPHFCPLILEPASQKWFCKYMNLANRIFSWLNTRYIQKSVKAMIPHFHKGDATK